MNSELRTCACGCGETFEVILVRNKSRQKYATAACRRRVGWVNFEQRHHARKVASPTVETQVTRVQYHEDGDLLITRGLSRIPTPTLGIWGY